MGKSKAVRQVLSGFSDLDVPIHSLESHGEESRHFLHMLRRNPRLVRENRIIHFKPGGDAEPIGLNPFASDLPAADIASLVLDALMKVWGAESLNDAPRIQRVLRNLFHIAAVHKLWWDDVFEMLLPSNKAFRMNLLAAVPDPRVRRDGAEMEGWPLPVKQEKFESSSSRIQKIVCATSAAAKAFRKQEKILDIAGMLRRRQSSVSDLSLLGSPEAESLVGAMLVNMFYHAVKDRPETQRDFTVFAIDEFPQFVTTDLARSLDQFRKFGVHLMLAHQRLDQLPEDLRSAILTCAKIKFVFGGLYHEDAGVLARELFPGEVRGDRVKHISYRTGFRPILTKTTLQHESEGEGEGENEGEGWTDISIVNTGTSNGVTDSDGTVVNTVTTTHSFGNSSGPSRSRSGSRNHIRTRGVSEAFVTEFQEFIEESGRQFWSCSDQWEMLTARTMNLDKREALVKIYNEPALDIRTPDVEIHPVFRRRKTARQRRLDQLRRQSEEKTNGRPIEGTVLPPQTEAEPEDYHD
jgi:TraM recognition site of TraD and TraG